MNSNNVVLATMKSVDAFTKTQVQNVNQAIKLINIWAAENNVSGIKCPNIVPKKRKNDYPFVCFTDSTEYIFVFDDMEEKSSSTALVSVLATVCNLMKVKALRWGYYEYHCDVDDCQKFQSYMQQFDIINGTIRIDGCKIFTK